MHVSYSSYDMHVSSSSLSAKMSCIPLLGLFSTLPEVRDAAVAPAFIGITLSVSVCVCLCLVRVWDKTQTPRGRKFRLAPWECVWEVRWEKHLLEKNISFYMNFTTKGGIPRKRPFPDYGLWKSPVRSCLRVCVCVCLCVCVCVYERGRMQIAKDSLPPLPSSPSLLLPPSLLLTASGMQLINGVVFVGEGIMMGCGSYRALALQTVVGGLGEKLNRKP
jgi:hypothetical protein